MNHMNKFVWLSLLWFSASIYALFFKPAVDVAPPFAHFDKCVHAGLFFAQFWLLSKVYVSRQQPLPWRRLLVLAVAWAAASEVLQATLTRTRQGDVWDAAADIFGAASAIWLAARLSRLRQNQPH